MQLTFESFMARGWRGWHRPYFYLEKNPHVFISSESVIDGAPELFHLGHKACAWARLLPSRSYCRGVPAGVPTAPAQGTAGGLSAGRGPEPMSAQPAHRRARRHVRCQNTFASISGAPPWPDKEVPGGPGGPQLGGLVV